jgi:hypothetical protein
MALEKAHREFLCSYLATVSSGRWSLIKDDGYIHSWLTWHLERAGMHEDLYRLLDDEEDGHNVWYSKRNETNRLGEYLQDVGRAWRVTWKKAESEIGQSESADTVGRMIQLALMQSSLNTHADRIPVGLLRELARTKVFPVDQALAYARQIPHIANRVPALVTLANILPEPYGPGVLQEALDGIRRVSEEGVQSYLFQWIAPYLPESSLDWVLLQLKRMQDVGERDQSIAAIICRWAHLGETHRAFEKMKELSSPEARCRALFRMAPLLSLPALRQALEVLRNTDLNRSTESARSALAIQLAKLGLPAEALEIARSLSTYLTFFLEHTASVFFDDELQTALELFEKIEKFEDVGHIGGKLSANLESEAQQRFLRHLIDKVWIDDKAMLGLIPFLPKSMLDDVSGSSSVQAAKARRFAELGDFEKTWECVEEITNSSERDDCIKSMVDLLRLTDVHRFLSSSQEADQNLKLALLRRLAELGNVSQVLKKAADLGLAWQQRLLGDVAHLLPKELLSDALQLTLNIKDGKQQMWAQVSLSPWLQEAAALELLKSINLTDLNDFAPLVGRIAKKKRELAPYIFLCLKEALNALPSAEYANRAKILGALVEIAATEPLVEATSIVVLSLLMDLWQETGRPFSPQGMAKLVGNLDLGSREIMQHNLGVFFGTGLTARDTSFSLVGTLFACCGPEQSISILNRLTSERARIKGKAFLASIAPEDLRNVLINEIVALSREQAAQSWLSAGQRTIDFVDAASQLPEELLLTVVKPIQVEGGYAPEATQYIPRLLELGFHDLAIQTLDALEGLDYRALALSHAAPHLHEPQRSEFLRLALEMSTQVQNPDGDCNQRSQIISDCATEVVALDRPVLFEVWSKCIAVLAAQKRDAFLMDISSLADIIHKLGGSDAVSHVSQSIKRVCRWWP